MAISIIAWNDEQLTNGIIVKVKIVKVNKVPLRVRLFKVVATATSTGSFPLSWMRPDRRKCGRVPELR